MSADPATPSRRTRTVNYGFTRPQYSMLTTLLLRVGAGILLIGGWEVGARSGALPAFFYSSPSAVVESIGRWWDEGVLLPSIGITLFEAIAGYVLGAFVGVVLALWLGTTRRLGPALEPFFTGFYSIPKIALVPFLIIWFGLGTTSKVFASALAVVVLVFFSVYSGVRNVDKQLVAQVRLYGASRWDFYRKLYLPATFMWLCVGLRSSLGFAFSAAVVAEYLGSKVGLGYLILQGQSTLRTGDIFAGLVITALVVIAIDLLLRRLEGMAARRQLG